MVVGVGVIMGCVITLSHVKVVGCYFIGLLGWYRLSTSMG